MVPHLASDVLVARDTSGRAGSVVTRDETDAKDDGDCVTSVARASTLRVKGDRLRLS